MYNNTKNKSSEMYRTLKPTEITPDDPTINWNKQGTYINSIIIKCHAHIKGWLL